MVGPFLEAVSNSLSASGGRSESAWRVLTLRGIDDLGGESSGVEPMMHRVLEILQPLIILSESAGFQKDLLKIINESITLWQVNTVGIMAINSLLRLVRKLNSQYCNITIGYFEPEHSNDKHTRSL